MTFCIARIRATAVTDFSPPDIEEDSQSPLPRKFPIRKIPPAKASSLFSISSLPSPLVRRLKVAANSVLIVSKADRKTFFFSESMFSMNRTIEVLSRSSSLMRSERCL